MKNTMAKLGTGIATLTIATTLYAGGDDAQELRHRVLQSGKPEAVEALKVLEKAGMLEATEDEKSDVGPDDILEAIRYFQEARGAWITGVLTGWDENFTRQLAWAQYDGQGAAVLHVGNQPIDLTNGAYFGDVEDYACRGAAIEVIAYPVVTLDANGELSGGQVLVNGMLLGEYGDVYVYETWVDDEKNVGQVLYSQGDELFLGDVPLLSAGAAPSKDRKPVPHRKVSEQEIAAWTATAEGK